MLFMEVFLMGMKMLFMDVFLMGMKMPFMGVKMLFIKLSLMRVKLFIMGMTVLGMFFMGSFAMRMSAAVVVSVILRLCIQAVLFLSVHCYPYMSSCNSALNSLFHSDSGSRDACLI